MCVDWVMIPVLRERERDGDGECVGFIESHMNARGRGLIQSTVPPNNHRRRDIHDGISQFISSTNIFNYLLDFF